MTINEILLFFFFLVNMGIFLAKVLNLFTFAKMYDLKFVFILLIVSLISNIIILDGSMALTSAKIVLPENPSSDISYVVEIPPNQAMTSSFLLRFSSFFTTLNIFFSIIETLIFISKHVLNQQRRLKNISKLKMWHLKNYL